MSLVSSDELSSEVQRDGGDLNAHVEWSGLPKFAPVENKGIKLVLSFEDEAERDRVVEILELVIAKKTGPTWSAWYPPREQEDLAALRFDFGGA